MPDTLLAGMVETFRVALPSFSEVGPHQGRLELADVKQMSVQSPALLLSCLSLADVLAAPEGRSVIMRMAAYVLVGDGRDESGQQIDKDKAALRLAGGVMAALDGAYWKLDEPRAVKAGNMHAASAQVAVALWAVTWDQPVMLGAPKESLDELNDFLTMGVVWDTAPPDGTPEIKDNTAIREE